MPEPGRAQQWESGRRLDLEARPEEADEPDFADEHTRPTYEDEKAESPGVPGDEEVPEGPGAQSQKRQRPL